MVERVYYGRESADEAMKKAAEQYRDVISDNQ